MNAEMRQPFKEQLKAEIAKIENKLYEKENEIFEKDAEIA